VNRTSGWDPDHGRRSAGLVGEVSSCRDRAVRPRRLGVGADAVAGGAAGGVGDAELAGMTSLAIRTARWFGSARWLGRARGLEELVFNPTCRMFGAKGPVPRPVALVYRVGNVSGSRRRCFGTPRCQQ
jgi:hypothetical protein